MKIFLDTADVSEIKKAISLGVLDGLTTNPSLVAKTGRKFEDLVKEILEMVPGPVSLEVVATDKEGILSQGRKLRALGKQVVVKVPLIPAGLEAVRVFSAEGIPTNVTLCFSMNQAWMAAKAGATYISPFIGRLDDIGTDGMQLIRDIRALYDQYQFRTLVLAASIRHPLHVHQCLQAGADVGTMPFKVIEQVVQHPLTDRGLDLFLKDWSKVPPTTLF